MAQVKSNKNIEKLDLSGKSIGDIVCQSFIQFGDVILIIDNVGKHHCYHKKSILKSPKKYLLKGKKVEKVNYSKDCGIFILETSDHTFFRDKSNQEIQGSEEWADFYLEPNTSSFFRKDSRGRWYDIQGYLLKTSFLIKDHVLCSLNGKTSKKSLFYAGQNMYINPNGTMVQVGKVVYDIDLNILKYFGEKITGLGSSNVTFNSSSSLQEIRLGLTKSAYINEINYKPFLINGEEIIRHISTKNIDNYTFEIFQSGEHEYVICNNLDNILQYNNETLKVEFETYIQLGSYHLIRVRNNQETFYYDLKSRKPFDPLTTGEFVLEINNTNVKKNNSILYNLKCKQTEYVFNALKDKVFTMEDDTITPENVQEVYEFDQHFYYATIAGVRKLCSHKTDKIIKVEDHSIEVSEILGDSKQKLVNILTTNNEHFALDIRFGFDNISLAKVGPYRIVETISEPTSLSNFILQNVHIQTLGGTKNRVVNLNEPGLSMFLLPSDLKAYSEQSDPSIFAKNEITDIDFKNKIVIGNKEFYNATFIDYLKESKSIILQKENARPLQLDGVGHRNEIVQSFDPLTLRKEYFLSDHRIIGVNSLTEDLKVSQLLFSFKTMSSWLPFYDTYLPIFKKIKDFEDEQEWEYHLFELHNISKEKEYIAVEQNPPFRILVDKSKSKYKPRIVKSKEIILKSPEEISAIRRFFSNPGYLVEVG